MENIGISEDMKEYLNDGISYLRIHRYEKAIIAFDLAIEVDPFYLLPYIEKERCLRKLGRHNEADEIHEIISDLQSETVLESSFPEHDPYSHILNLLSKKNGSTELENLLESHADSLNALIHGFNQSDLQISNEYNDIALQEAYLLYYYPYYIETVYRELLQLDKKYLENSLSHHLAICYYGCGAAPEYMGTLKFVSSKLELYRYLSVYFFDKNEWDATRESCINHIGPHYCEDDSLNIMSKTNHLDLLSFKNGNNIRQYPEIRSSKIHIFQNCMRDLIQFSEDKDDVLWVLHNIFSALQAGSILLISEMYYPKTKLYLNRFAEYIEKHSAGIILQPVSEMRTYRPNFSKPKEIRSFFEKNTGRDRSNTRYFSFIVMKT